MTKRSIWSFWAILKNESGKADSKLPGFIILVFLVVGGYVGFHFFVPWFNHRVMKDFVAAEAVMDGFERRRPTEDTIKNNIIVKMKEQGIVWNGPNDQEILEVNPKTDIAFEIRLRYKEIVRLQGFNPRTLWYDIYFDGSKMAEAVKIPNSELDTRK